VFARPQPAPAHEGGYVALMEACLVVLRGRAGRAVDSAPVYQPGILTVWRVPDALARIRALLAAQPTGGVLHQFLPLLAADEPSYRLKARAAVAGDGGPCHRARGRAGLRGFRLARMRADNPGDQRAVTVPDW
jgi:segregation and condensation protein A